MENKNISKISFRGMQKSLGAIKDEPTILTKQDDKNTKINHPLILNN